MGFHGAKAEVDTYPMGRLHTQSHLRLRLRSGQANPPLPNLPPGLHRRAARAGPSLPARPRLALTQVLVLTCGDYPTSLLMVRRRADPDTLLTAPPRRQMCLT